MLKRKQFLVHHHINGNTLNQWCKRGQAIRLSRGKSRYIVTTNDLVAAFSSDKSIAIEGLLFTIGIDNNLLILSRGESSPLYPELMARAIANATVGDDTAKRQHLTSGDDVEIITSLLSEDQMIKLGAKNV